MTTTIITYPHLNDRKGDMSRKWYVEYAYRIAGSSRRRRVRKYFSSELADERYKAAEEYIKIMSEWLKNGGHEKRANGERVLISDIDSPEHKTYTQHYSRIPTPLNRLNRFLSFKNKSLTQKSRECYLCRMKQFAAYMDRKHLGTQYIRRKDLIEYVEYLAGLGLSKVTITKAMGIVHSYFNWEIDEEVISENPCVRLPRLGTVVDQAAAPLSVRDIVRLRDLIRANDPWLWLACEIEYYCAIRPNEMRELKVKDIDIERKTIKVSCVYAKNRQTEFVSIPSVLLNHLKTMLEGVDQDLYVFGRERRPSRVQCGKNRLRQRFNRFRDQLGISTEIKFYSWKHTGAIDAIDAGMQPFQLQQHLRHKSFETTEIYLKKRKPANTDVDRFFGEL